VFVCGDDPPAPQTGRFTAVASDWLPPACSHGAGLVRIKWQMASNKLASAIFLQRLLMNLSVANFEQGKDTML
jgi:hypothetical protein